MPSTLDSRNITIDGQRTSIRLEPYMWDALEEICAIEGLTIHEFCSRVERTRGASSRTAAIRVAILQYYREGLKQRGLMPSPAGTDPTNRSEHAAPTE